MTPDEEGGTVTFNLEINAEPSYNQLRRLEAVLMRVMGWLRRFSGSESVERNIDAIQKIIMSFRSMMLMIHMIEVASGPIGWAYAAVTVVATVGVMAEMG